MEGFVDGIHLAYFSYDDLGSVLLINSEKNIGYTLRSGAHSLFVDALSIVYVAHLTRTDYVRDK